MAISKPKFLLLALPAVVLAAFGAILTFNLLIGPGPSPPPQRDRAEIEAACRQDIIEAERRALVAIDHRAAEFSSFIEERKSGARPFAEDIVSLYGKWVAIKSRLPFTDAQGHKIFIQQSFSKHVFTTEALAERQRRAVTDSLRDLEAIENDLAVQLHHQLLSISYPPDVTPNPAAVLSNAMAQIATASQWDAAKSAGSLVVSEVAAQIGTQVVLRIAVSSGILAAGAANSMWTVGAALVIGVFVDGIWEWIDDPVSDIERKTVAAMDDISIQGANAIRDEMSIRIFQRRQFWQNAVKESLP